MSEPLFPRVKRTIDRHHLLEKEDRLIVGVSGGVDSMVLLYLLNRLREPFALDLVVAHVNHGLRPEESQKEAELVRKESERLGLPFEYGQVDVKTFQKARGFSPQDAARRLRFRFFDELMNKRQAGKVALGQNADDQVETVLLRLMRGSGLAGLKGILTFRDGRVIRPLLSVWRKEIESYAAEHHIPYLVDSSNLKKEYLRNRIRLELIPLIERGYQSNFKGALLKTSIILQEENEYLDQSAEEAYGRVIRLEDGRLSFNCSDFRSLHKAIRWRVVRKLLKRMIPESVADTSRWPDPLTLSQKLSRDGSFYIEFPPGFFIEKRYDTVCLGKGRQAPVPPFEVTLVVPGPVFLQAVGKKVVSEEVSRVDGLKETPPNTALLDYHRLQFPLKIRNVRPGDRFRPLGVKGTQKLKEFFIDHKVPAFERARIPLLISGESIAWVAGYRIDERFKITDRTERVLKVEVVTGYE